MAELILLLERSSSGIDATFVKSQIDDSTTVVSAQVPSYSPEFGMVREEWTGAHHQHGVDLARLDNDLRLRDVILVTIPEPTTSRRGLLHVWTSPKSTYDIDAIQGTTQRERTPLTSGFFPHFLRIRSQFLLFLKSPQ